MTDRARRGRTIILAIIGWYVLIDILTILLASRANGSQLAFILVLSALEIVLFFFLYAGSSLARWAAGVLSILMGVFGVWIVLFIHNLNFAGLLVFFCLGGSFLLAAGLLFFSPDVREYFLYK